MTNSQVSVPPIKSRLRSLLDGLAHLWLRFRRSVKINGLPMAIWRSIRRLFRSLRHHGLTGTASRAAHKPGLIFDHEAPLPTHPFDILHGVDTSGYIRSGVLLNSASAIHTVAYYGISPSTLHQGLTRIPAPLDRFTFVDIGCGKGRALIVAAQFHFARLIGVDLAAELCEIAVQNLALVPAAAGRVSVLNVDAITLVYPETPLVIFLYDPFYAPILRKVLANLERQLRRSPRETYILYAANRLLGEFDRFPSFELLWDAQIPLSPEDAAVDRHGLIHEHYTLHKSTLSP